MRGFEGQIPCLQKEYSKADNMEAGPPRKALTYASITQWRMGCGLAGSDDSDGELAQKVEDRDAVIFQAEGPSPFHTTLGRRHPHCHDDHGSRHNCKLRGHHSVLSSSVDRENKVESLQIGT
ncbi:hypothetical protein BDN67DRAFT_105285 [Paxillus ammoniavirescens]|nr:hypothetical protein BDN67DRAFT_105285 [Paxillus ammoniavirescens]